MNKSKFITGIIFLFFSMIFVLQTLPEQKTVNVEKKLMKLINANNQVKSKILKELTGQNLAGSSFKLTGLILQGTLEQAGNIKIGVEKLSEEWEVLGGTELANCFSTPINTAEETFTTTLRDTTTVTKTMNLSYTQHAEAKITIEIVEVGGGWSATMGYSQSWEDSSFEQHSVSKTLTSSPVPSGKGLVLTLLHKKLTGDKIPYEAIFKIANNTKIFFTFEAINGSADLYEHFNYGGKHASLDWNQQVPDLKNSRFQNLKDLFKKISSAKVYGGAQLILFKRPNYKGNNIILTGNTSSIDNFNDKCQSLKLVQRPVITGTVKYNKLNNILPNDFKQFKSTGYIAIDKNFGDIVKTVVYEMTPDQFAKECPDYQPASSGAVTGTAGSKTTAVSPDIKKPRSKKLTKAQIKEMLRSGKIKKK
ncbi:MAG: hypothetical protein ABFR75_08595 [Acidobacteriota bacterium]